MGRNLTLENLTKRFGTLTAVDRVNLEIVEGEFICFLGPSGCGKTTVLRMITGFETVTDGKVTFDGRSSTISSLRKENSASFSSPTRFSRT